VIGGNERGVYLREQRRNGPRLRRSKADPTSEILLAIRVNGQTDTKHAIPTRPVNAVPFSGANVDTARAV